MLYTQLQDYGVHAKFVQHAVGEKNAFHNFFLVVGFWNEYSNTQPRYLFDFSVVQQLRVKLNEISPGGTFSTYSANCLLNF